MPDRVCIPSAGLGERLENLTKYINKPLLNIANKPAISYIIEKFSEDTEFVIPLGYKGDLIRQFVELAYPNRKFFFVDVFPFKGHGSGLGHSLISCKEYLQQPFIFISCDTIVDEQIPLPNKDWIAYSKNTPHNFSDYRTLSVKKNIVQQLNEKGTANNKDKVYIGLCGINSYIEFWSEMERDPNQSKIIGESFGLQKIITLKNVQAISFTWHDTGNLETLKSTREYFKKDDDPNILDKEKEAIWFINDTVVKFSDDTSFIANRIKRATVLKKYIPNLIGHTRNMYAYTKCEGKVFSDIATPQSFVQLLNHSSKFWKIKKLDSVSNTLFKKSCLKFYKEKTIDRINMFYETFNQKDDAYIINDLETENLEKLIENINWEWISDGIPGNFHGDFHFENIVLSSNNKFIFLDWRQDFDGNITIGDIYYDFSKLLHGLIINHEIIANNEFSVSWKDKIINYDFRRKQMLVDCEKAFYQWLDDNQHDKQKVIILTALIYLNIAPLHHFPYSLLLYAHGKSMLHNALNEDNE